ncbi:hypothetical protein IV203_025274 [Nitzschia inconspicua]|uniref:Uncharacterized protein n=1 Tax=Nitzschia inconspicua TaxID=303405 RepID=A0A9K3KA11_9STRA|nr:hypothetical protein IV203_024721 [Nitzschia inconspicua]KAG7362390.1 hypothetical protein IV203_025274 [Nitzschia inconspicua]
MTKGEGAHKMNKLSQGDERIDDDHCNNDYKGCCDTKNNHYTGDVRIAMQLIAGLVSGRVGGDSFPLSDEQVSLKIDRRIVYLASLCFVEENPLSQPSFTVNVATKLHQARCIPSRLKNRFRVLQKMYRDLLLVGQENSNQSSTDTTTTTTTFELSPRLCPSKEQLAFVLHDIQQIQNRLEQQAQTTAEELLRELQEQPKRRSNKTKSSTPQKKRDSKSKPTLKEKTRTEEFVYNNNNTETLQQLLKQRFVTEEDAACRNGNNDQWVEVSRDKKKNGSSKTSASPTLLSHVQTEHSEVSCTDLCSSPIVSPGICQKQNLTRVEDTKVEMVGEDEAASTTLHSTDKVRSTSSNEIVPVHVPVTAFGTEPLSQPLNISPATDQTIGQTQEDRIRSLEVALEETKKEHEKVLLKERQGYEDLIQSLQLRLYISETRLKTYEEALQRHIESVATNISGGGIPSSPVRTMSAVDSTMENAVSSPRSLIAKILQQNAKKEQSDEPIQGIVREKQESKPPPRRRGGGGERTTVTKLKWYAIVIVLLHLDAAFSTKLLHNILRKQQLTTQWLEQIPSNDTTDDVFGLDTKDCDRVRQTILFGRFRACDRYEGLDREMQNGEKSKHIEHPLRTDRWQFDIRWKRKGMSIQKLGRENDTQQDLRMDLHRSGYVRVSCDQIYSTDFSHEIPIAIGRWFKRPWGVSIVVRPLTWSAISTEATSESLSSLIASQNLEWVFFASAFHCNPFRDQPKLTQGVVMRQRPERGIGAIVEESDDTIFSSRTRPLSWVFRLQWFRPVVGTFSAHGI